MVQTVPNSQNGTPDPTSQAVRAMMSTVPKALMTAVWASLASDRHSYGDQIFDIPGLPPPEGALKEELLSSPRLALFALQRVVPNIEKFRESVSETKPDRAKLVLLTEDSHHAVLAMGAPRAEMPVLDETAPTYIRQAQTVLLKKFQLVGTAMAATAWQYRDAIAGANLLDEKSQTFSELTFPATRDPGEVVDWLLSGSIESRSAGVGVSEIVSQLQESLGDLDGDVNERAIERICQNAKDTVNAAERRAHRSTIR